MHELSLMAALVEQVEELSSREKFGRVHEIRIAVGALSGAEPSCLEFCFSEAVRESVLAGAKLILHSIPVELSCSACGARSTPDDTSALACDQCRSPSVTIVRGKEFKIEELEVD